MNSVNIKQLMEAQGAVLWPSSESVAERLSQVKAFLFDWDGVFNTGEKSNSLGSPFNEADSMGINLLRFSYWKQKGHLPKVALLSGERSETALNWAQRESLHACYFKCGNKTLAFEHFLQQQALEASEVAYFFDDVLDLGIAENCGLRIFFPRKNNPLFNQFVLQNHLADYICSTNGGNFAIREATELLIYLNGNFEEVIKERMHHEIVYKDYLNERNQIRPAYFTTANQLIVAATLD
jgi:3-deoxy-D-manno-octulosonate 8-phosphate phosphatase (KDO 8-P phosphatase)